MRQADPVLDTDTAAFLEGGCGMVLAVALDDGTPVVARGWGLAVTEHNPPRVRLLIPADDAAVLERLRDTSHVAVTAGSVRTYRAIQLKGRSVAVEEATKEDRARAARYIDAFFTDLLDVYGMPRELCDRFAPVDVTACTITVDSLYDQTPGPGAGAALTSEKT
jgi:hypothetical protein